MLYVGIVLFIVGVGLLAVGYRRNRRGLLLAGAIVLFLSAVGGEFTHGLVDGWQAGYGGARTGQPGPR